MKLCISCGDENKTELDLCKKCKSLADEVFYNIEDRNEAKQIARRFFKHPDRDIVTVNVQNANAKILHYFSTLGKKRFSMKDLENFIEDEIKTVLHNQKQEVKDTNSHIDKLFDDHKKDKIGILPSTCSICGRKSKNDKEFTVLNEEEQKKYIDEGKKLRTPCGSCGSVAHFLKEFYGFDAEKVNKFIKLIEQEKNEIA